MTVASNKQSSEDQVAHNRLLLNMTVLSVQQIRWWHEWNPENATAKATQPNLACRSSYTCKHRQFCTACNWYVSVVSTLPALLQPWPNACVGRDQHLHCMLLTIPTEASACMCFLLACMCLLFSFVTMRVIILIGTHHSLLFYCISWHYNVQWLLAGHHIRSAIGKYSEVFNGIVKLFTHVTLLQIRVSGNQGCTISDCTVWCHLLPSKLLKSSVVQLTTSIDFQYHRHQQSHRHITSQHPQHLFHVNIP